ncbi:MAG: hypothetical protein ABSG68_05400, partial [Thermoguttaceae bacterium]
MVSTNLMANYSWVWDADGQPLQECESIELAFGDPSSARNFWAIILLTAFRDHATSVFFFPFLGEGCLSFAVGDSVCAVIPPPEGFRAWLLRAGRNLSAGSTWRGIIWWWKSRVLRRRSRGLVTLVYPG